MIEPERLCHSKPYKDNVAAVERWRSLTGELRRLRSHGAWRTNEKVPTFEYRGERAGLDTDETSEKLTSLAT